MLFGLVAVVQRRVPGVGHTTARDLLRRELVHVLCEGPMSFSRIQKHLPVSMRESVELEDVLREVSTCGEDGMFTVTKVLETLYLHPQRWYKGDISAAPPCAFENERLVLIVIHSHPYFMLFDETDVLPLFCV